MKTHRLDPFSLVAGLLFAALGVGFMLDELDVWTADVAWVPGVIVIVLGVGGILAGVLRARTDRGVDTGVDTGVEAT